MLFQSAKAWFVSAGTMNCTKMALQCHFRISAFACLSICGSCHALFTWNVFHVTDKFIAISSSRYGLHLIDFRNTDSIGSDFHFLTWVKYYVCPDTGGVSLRALCSRVYNRSLWLCIKMCQCSYSYVTSAEIPRLHANCFSQSGERLVDRFHPYVVLQFAFFNFVLLATRHWGQCL